MIERYPRSIHRKIRKKSFSFGTSSGFLAYFKYFFLYLFHPQFSEPKQSQLESLSVRLQLLQYRYNIWLRWSKFNAAFQHPHNFSRFSLNLSGGMLTGQHQMISGNRIFPFYVFFCYREHILYQKCAFPAIVQLNDMENITRFPTLFPLRYGSGIFSKNLSLIV